MGVFGQAFGVHTNASDAASEVKDIAGIVKIMLLVGYSLEKVL